MFWPVEAVLIVAALAGCWCAAAAAETAWHQRSRSLALVAAAITASLGAEVAALNGAAPGGSLDGVGLVAVLMAGVALAALATYLLLPIPPVVTKPSRPLRTGPAANPDSEA